MRAVIASGTGRYSDPWHPLADTSERLRRIVADEGFDVEVIPDVDAALAGLDGVDLLVVNATDPWRNGETGTGAPEDSTAGLGAAVQRGIGIVAMHNAIASLRDYPVWRTLLGGDWIPGVSGHPPLGDLVVRPVDGAPFTLSDEGYIGLEFDGDAEVLAHHELEGVSHPLLWRRQVGPTRVVYDALGHDGRSFDSAEHVELLREALSWSVHAPRG